jgi:fido (protein-threonine AMPylation protein)
MLSCSRCRALREQLSGELPEDVHLCQLLDVDIVRHMHDARDVGAHFPFIEATEVIQAIERNAVRVELGIRMRAFPSDGPSFLAYVCEMHRGFLFGTALYGGGGRFREGAVTFGPESKLRHGFAPERIRPELERLARRFLPVDPTSLSREALASCGARLVHGFLAVHPFPDVNGRTARAFFRALVLATGRFETRPVKAEEERSAQDAYVRALQAVDAAVDFDDRSHDAHYVPLARWLDSFIVEPEDEEDER